MVDFVVKYLEKNDKEISIALKKEVQRQRRNIELIASENIISNEVMFAMSNVLTNKYAEGYPGKRYYGGCEYADIVENLAIERAKELFSCEYANVQPHSGAQANMAVYFALLEYGDKVLGMNLNHGGHLTHGSPVNISGKYFNFTPYNVDENGFIDYDEVLKIAKEVRPKMIVAGASAYSRKIDFQKFKIIADEVGAYLFVDMAHIAGLVAAGLHQNPLPYADVVTTTTHKTLRGPRGGMILSNNVELGKKLNSAVFPGTQGGPLMHIIAAKAVSFKEALQPEFVEYQTQVIKNAKALAKGLKEGGFNLVSNGTDNHLMLVDLRNKNVTGKELEENLDNVYITVNKNSIPDDPKSPFITSGIRVGTPLVTTRGMKEEEMGIIAKLIHLAVIDVKKYEKTIKEYVNILCKKFPIY